MKKILMATDLSARSDRALQRAVMLADEFDAELKILHVVDEASSEAVTIQHEAAARSALAAQVSALPLAKRLKLSQDIARGFDQCDISVRASDFGADLIVLGIHRHRSRELFRGTTAERVIRCGNLPVLVVKDPPLKPYRRVLIGVDRSEHSVAAMALAAKIALQGEVFLLHVAHRPFSAFLGRETQNQLIRAQRDILATEIKTATDRLSAELGTAAPRFELVLKEGDVHQVIRSQVTAIKPDLLALGTHGRTGLAHAVIGSIAEDLLADAPVDVLAVKGR